MLDEYVELLPEEKREEFKTKTATLIENSEDSVIDFVKGKQNIFDKITAAPMESRLKNWQDKEMPALITAAENKIREELKAPELTEDQIELKKLREKDTARDLKEAQLNRRELLRVQYKDIDSDLAAKMYKLEDTEIKESMESVNKLKLKIVELETKLQFGQGIPNLGGKPKSVAEMTVDEAMIYAKTSSAALAEVLAYQKQNRS